MRRTSGVVAVLAAVLVIGACGSDGDPVADAGDDFSIAVGQSPTFDGCGSDGDIDNYRWVIIEAPSLMEDDANKPLRDIDSACTFTLEAAMEVQEIGTWVIELTVSDAAGATSSDRVTVEVAG